MSLYYSRIIICFDLLGCLIILGLILEASNFPGGNCFGDVCTKNGNAGERNEGKSSQASFSVRFLRDEIEKD